MAHLDSGDFEDALINLSINAMHAMDSTGTFTIRTENKRINECVAGALQLVAGDYVVLSVSDTGCGIDKDNLERIFEPFYSTKGKKGTGLGLTQAYGFIERSNGAIDVNSEPSIGTRFTLYFPRYVEEERFNQVVNINYDRNLEGHETILVVDDEPALLDLAKEILGRQKYNVICAESGKQALEILKHDAVDLLFSDVVMPEMDGYELAAQVMEKYPDVKIQLASGFTDEHRLKIVDDSLHKGLINKPYNSETLLKRIRELLG